MPLIDAIKHGEIIATAVQELNNFISSNYKWDAREGTLPQEYNSEFASALAGFSVTVRGIALKKTEDITIDGVTYRWLNFEEDGESQTYV